jgi:cation diffusion facilitator CzcD-associated flavoprotein CzcO
MRELSTEHFEVAIVGSGFAGLCMAIKLRDAGIESFVVLERSDSIGGTWRENHYPGCACDVQAHLYSFSFAPNPRWSRMFAPQQEIRDYLEHCADRFGVRAHVRLRAEVRRAEYDEDESRWQIELADGNALSARALILGKGLLSQPHTPRIPGLESFAGHSFHSASWDHKHDLRGRSVGVIGTGASTIQFVPRIAAAVKHLYLFQRTPPWILPKLDRSISALEQGIFQRVPAAQRLYRGVLYWRLEARILGFAVEPRIAKSFELMARAHIRRQIKDPELRQMVTPDYRIGCKRVLMSNDYYPALTGDNVEVVTDRIERATERGLVTREHREYPLDTIVFGCGFNPFDLGRLSVVGRDGLTLEECWAATPKAYRGTTVAGFPNLFLLVGPNTGLGHSSMVFVIESQVNYVLDTLRMMHRRGLRSVEVRHDAQGAWNASVGAKLTKTVWASGCDSWYLDADGRNPTIWPTFSFLFRWATRRFRAEDYHLLPRGPSAEPIATSGL